MDPGPAPASGTQAAPTELFVAQVREALEHLYDLPHLQKSPVVTGATETGLPGDSLAQRLRRELLQAIEDLSPGPDVPFRAPPGRLHHILHLVYVEGMTALEAGHELGISPRQAYRDLKLGAESVATILWTQRRAQGTPSGQPSAPPVASEVMNLPTRPRATDLRGLLEHALQAVERLAAQRGINLEADLPDGQATVSADPAMARQLLVGTLSRAVREAAPGALQVALTLDAAGANVVLRYRSSMTDSEDPAMRPLAGLLGWDLVREHDAEAHEKVVITAPAAGATVLVIDDNVELAGLLQRYLGEHGCRVVAAASGPEGLEVARTAPPDAIVLDVMMPDMDGWETLQRLHTDPQTAAIPLVVCSVFNDPELAYSLGAAHYLAKPVTQDALLAALRDLGLL